MAEMGIYCQATIDHPEFLKLSQSVNPGQGSCAGKGAGSFLPHKAVWLLVV